MQSCFSILHRNGSSEITAALTGVPGSVLTARSPQPGFLQVHGGALAAAAGLLRWAVQRFLLSLVTSLIFSRTAWGASYSGFSCFSLMCAAKSWLVLVLKVHLGHLNGMGALFNGEEEWRMTNYFEPFPT